MTTKRSTKRWFGMAAAAVVALAALVLAAVAGWSSVGGTEAQPAAAVARHDPTTSEPETTTSTEVTTTTTAEVTTTGPAPPPPPGFGPGDTGDAVMALEQKLDALKYDVGDVDGTFDKITGYGVMAFQKVKDMDRSGRATDDVIAAVNATEGPPPALVTGGPPSRVEVDIARQVLFLYEGGQIYKILPVSTGSNARFCSEGYCRKAVTPGGSYSVYRAGRGMGVRPAGRPLQPAVLQRRCGHPRRPVGARRPGLPRLRPHPDERRRVVPVEGRRRNRRLRPRAGRPDQRAAAGPGARRAPADR